MGFRANGYMTVWEVRPGRTDKTTSVRMSSSRKNKQTDTYEQDFSHFTTFIGAAAEKARSLQERSRIKLLECEVTTRYDKEKNMEYINFAVFDFENVEQNGTGDHSGGAVNTATQKALDGDIDEDDVPF